MYRLIISFIAVFIFTLANAQVLPPQDFKPQKGIALLDMTSRNGDREDSGDYARQVYSAQYICDVAGYNYFVTTSLDEAMENGSLILFSSRIKSSTFTLDELDSLIKWVKDGGVVVSPMITAANSSVASRLSGLFGINASAIESPVKTFSKLVFNDEYSLSGALSYFDTADEKEITIGAIKSSPMEATTADVLATFDGTAPAITRNRLGDGAAYIVGLMWRDVIQRPQLNKQPSGVTPRSNEFSSFADTWPLMVRGIFAELQPVSAWKFTVPAGYTQVLVPTHDCDSTTAYEEMGSMGEYEKGKGLESHFFLTVHYYRDRDYHDHSYFSAFYNDETIAMAKDIVANGHTVGSHSIGHYPDFNKTDNMDIVTRDEYARRATYDGTRSTGVSTWAEIVMSKNILEEDLGNNVRSFRPGHLMVNKDFPQALAMGSYDFASCYTSSSVLGNFPYYTRMANAWEGELTDILQIPLHISDVYTGEGKPKLDDDSWESHPCVDEWTIAMEKLAGNYANGVLLIHPNRDWKVTLERRLVNRIGGDGFGLYNFEDYGDWWKARVATAFDTFFDESTKTLYIRSNTPTTAGIDLTYAVEANTAVDKVVVFNSDLSESRECHLRRLASNRLLAVPFDLPQSVYPDGEDNNGSSWVEIGATNFPLDNSANVLFDLHGRKIDTDFDSLQTGIYLIRTSGGSFRKIYKK